MRILKVTQAYHPFQSRGGPAVKVRSIARELVRQGHQVTVLTADLGFGPDEMAAATALRNGHGWRSNLDGVESIYLPTQGNYRNITVNAGVISFCRRRLREFDLAHVYGLYDILGPVVARYCHRFGIPYLVEPLGMHRAYDRGILLKRIWGTLARSYLSQASKMIATSDQERAELIVDGIPADRVLLRYNGLDLKEFLQLPPPGTFRAKAGLGDGERFILFLGRIIPRKGADLLIQALPHLGDTKLVIAGPEGEAGYMTCLRAQARELGVAHRVLFPGALYGDNKIAAMADAAVFALPSRYENFGNTAAEAIACGTPAIVSDRCGIAPFVHQRAGLVTAYDSAALTRTLKELLGDAILYRRLKGGCAAVAEELSWPELVRGMQASYKEAISGKPAAAEAVYA